MCEKCEELRQNFLAASGIGPIPRQEAWNAWDKQRTKCAKGEAKPKPGPALPVDLHELKKEREEIVAEKPEKKKAEVEKSEKPICHYAAVGDNPFCGFSTTPATIVSGNSTHVTCEECKERLGTLKSENPVKKTKTKPAAKKKKWVPIPGDETEQEAKTKKCKYLYRGGLCANSQMDKPFCSCPDDLSKCPVGAGKLAPK